MKVFIIVMAVALVSLVAAKSSSSDVQLPSCDSCVGCKEFFTNIQTTLEDTMIQGQVAGFAGIKACAPLQAAGSNFIGKACEATFKILVPLAMEYVAVQVNPQARHLTALLTMAIISQNKFLRIKDYLKNTRLPGISAQRM